MPATNVFEVLREADIDPTGISCVQRHSNGSILFTFRRRELKDQFLQCNYLSIHGQPLALQETDRPLTYLQIFDAPHELPDLAIVSRISKYCDVVSQRRGNFHEPGWEAVQNRVRHYRVHLKQPIPNFIRFGKVLVNFRYP